MEDIDVASIVDHIKAWPYFVGHQDLRNVVKWTKIGRDTVLYNEKENEVVSLVTVAHVSTLDK